MSGSIGVSGTVDEETMSAIRNGLDAAALAGDIGKCIEQSIRRPWVDQWPDPRPGPCPDPRANVSAMLDRDERDAVAIGYAPDQSLTFAAQVEGFEDWPDVVRLAREFHPVAVELLARRVERTEAEALVAALEAAP